MEATLNQLRKTTQSNKMIRAAIRTHNLLGRRSFLMSVTIANGELSPLRYL